MIKRSSFILLGHQVEPIPDSCLSWEAISNYGKSIFELVDEMGTISINRMPVMSNEEVANFKKTFKGVSTSPLRYHRQYADESIGVSIIPDGVSVNGSRFQVPVSTVTRKPRKSVSLMNSNPSVDGVHPVASTFYTRRVKELSDAIKVMPKGTPTSLKSSNNLPDFEEFNTDPLKFNDFLKTLGLTDAQLGLVESYSPFHAVIFPDNTKEEVKSYMDANGTTRD